MKFRIMLLTVIMMFSTQMIFAGSISDVYTAGDTLTAAKMDSIKSAVNDNDTNISTNSANVTINSDNVSSNAAKIVTLEGKVPRTTITVLVSTTVVAGSFGCAVAMCPTSHPIAIGGGIDLGNVFTMQVTQSTPGINGSRPISTADGTYNNASDEWRGCAINNSASTENVAVSVICSSQ